METERWRHVSIARAVEIDFYKNAENIGRSNLNTKLSTGSSSTGTNKLSSDNSTSVIATVRFDRFGRSEITLDDQSQPLVSAWSTDDFSFAFTRNENRLFLKTSFGVSLSMKGKVKNLIKISISKSYLCKFKLKMRIINRPFQGMKFDFESRIRIMKEK